MLKCKFLVAGSAAETDIRGTHWDSTSDQTCYIRKDSYVRPPEADVYAYYDKSDGSCQTSAGATSAAKDDLGTKTITECFDACQASNDCAGFDYDKDTSGCVTYKYDHPQVGDADVMFANKKCYSKKDMNCSPAGSCNGLDMCKWSQVRHLPAGTKWHKAKDHLLGTEEYGAYTDST